MAEPGEDTQKWLEEVLDRRDSWNSENLNLLLTASKITEISECFCGLPTQIKLKILMSIVCMPEEDVEECQEQLKGLLATALDDFEGSVVALAEFLQDFPSTGSINHELKTPENEKNAEIYKSGTAQLAEELAKAKAPKMVPLECKYMSKAALEAVMGVQEPPVQHLRITGRTKAEKLRQRVLEEVEEARNTENLNPEDNDQPTKTPPASTSSLDRIDHPIGIRLKGVPMKISVQGVRPGSPN